MRDNPSNITRLIELGGVQDITRMMTRHVSAAALMSANLTLLCHLCHRNNDNKKMICEYGGSRCVMTVLSHHYRDPQVIEHALRCLANFSFVEGLTSIVHAHMQYICICTYICIYGMCLMTLFFGKSENVAKLVKEQILEVVFPLFNNHNENEKVLLLIQMLREKQIQYSIIFSPCDENKNENENENENDDTGDDYSPKNVFDDEKEQANTKSETRKVVITRVNRRQSTQPVNITPLQMHEPLLKTRSKTLGNLRSRTVPTNTRSNKTQTGNSTPLANKNWLRNVIPVNENAVIKNSELFVVIVKVLTNCCAGQEQNAVYVARNVSVQILLGMEFHTHSSSVLLECGKLLANVATFQVAAPHLMKKGTAKVVYWALMYIQCIHIYIYMCVYMFMNCNLLTHIIENLKKKKKRENAKNVVVATKMIQ
ncbi:hypothetical protein RFI_34810, partial [Reticulomyxa filosa]